MRFLRSFLILILPAAAAVALIGPGCGSSEPSGPSAASASTSSGAPGGAGGVGDGGEGGGGAGVGGSGGAAAGGGGIPSAGLVPLIDMGADTYLGFSGGLYPGGNAMPPEHAAVGAAAAKGVEPRDVNGAPSPAGQIVLLSIGMSSTAQEFCSQNGEVPCEPWTFTGLAAADPKVDAAALRIVNGAKAGQEAETWDSLGEVNYDRVRNDHLAPLGLTEAQVQVIWLKLANDMPSMSLPSDKADAYALEATLGEVVRAARYRYKNLKQIFLSSRIYAGYATTDLNPEPYAYESGFAVKWLIEAQIAQAKSDGGVVDARAGDLGPSVAPWLAWGPYLWANGEKPRSDGLAWSPSDFQPDGTHPSASGEEKVGEALLAFFKTSPHAKCWFLSGGACP